MTNSIILDNVGVSFPLYDTASRSLRSQIVSTSTGGLIGSDARPGEDIERIFAPYERGRLIDKAGVPGMGLGLTISRVLAQIMGGELTVRSKVGAATGVRFTPTLSFVLDKVPEVSAHMEALLAKAREADADLARIREGAVPAGDADPYRVSGGDARGDELDAEDTGDDDRYDR